MSAGRVGEAAELGEVSPLQNDGPLPLNTIPVTDGSSCATASASSNAARVPVQKALCRSGRLKLIRRMSPSRCTVTGLTLSGTRAGPRCASQRANSGPDCNVE